MTQKKEQQEIVNIFTDAENLYDAVLAQLNIDHNDEIYRNLVLGVLKRQTKDHLIFSIWNNLDKAQTEHLRQFINQTSVTMPFLSVDDALLEFAMMYPGLMNKIYAGLTGFFKSFIAKFNEINEA